MSKPLEIQGQQFGNWITITRIVTKDYRTRWICECQCKDKTRREVAQDSLVRGTSTSCGCLKREKASARKVDYKGQKFGNWVIIGEDSKKSGDRYAICRCECEDKTVKTVRLKDVVYGRNTSCGCLRKAMVSEKFSLKLEGQTFGRLTVLKRVENNKANHSRFLCRCSCDGKEVEVVGVYLTGGGTRSCGCLKDELTLERITTHNQSKTRLYQTWCGMKSRCYRKTKKDYKYYGARGIKVCDEWHDFTKFKEWAEASGYEEHLTIERKDNNKNYEPSNCEWITLKEQNKNRRNIVYITFNGETKNLTEWARHFKKAKRTIYKWREKGMLLDKFDEWTKKSKEA